MELYHLHIKNYKSNIWKEGKTITIDKSFDNRLALRIKNNCFSVDSNKYRQLTDMYNYVMQMFGYECISGEVPINNLMEVCRNNDIDKKTLLNLVLDASRMISNANIANREMALENYRLKYNSNLPSRLHCIYASKDVDGVDRWRKSLVDDDLELFRIETDEEPFEADEHFLPDVSKTYIEMYNDSFRYWNPKFKSLDTDNSREFLIQGKVKILEKMGEIPKSSIY